ncbi:MAG: hypothetical protein NZM12_13700, partial [Steroidobacteraceae bacterium]|nr:hypothetical protein [Steroidobacteraceae bacterium]MDW8259500.1 hypothetical protein [Gammaproteobacteria bacterium]
AAGLAAVLPSSELDALRLELLGKLKDEGLRGGSSLRTRLFGSAMTLAAIERMTSQSFFAALARRIELHARVPQDPKWLAAIRESDSRAVIVVRGRLYDERESPETLQLVEVVADGKDWRPAIPREFRAQVADLLAGRQRVRVADAGTGRPGASPTTAADPGTTAADGARSATAALPAGNPPGIIAMLEAAEKVLTEGRCDRYYRDFMSPAFRRTQSPKAMETLINACQRSLGTRELLISALRIVKQLPPRFDADGRRASYDVADHGLPYERFTLELIDRRWYIAE